MAKDDSIYDGLRKHQHGRDAKTEAPEREIRVHRHHLEYWEDLTLKLKRYNEAVRNRVQENATETWKEGMNSKPGLSLYKECRERGVTARGLYNNDRGSTLRALARTGILPTRTHRAEYQPIDPVCQKCGREAEAIPT